MLFYLKVVQEWERVRTLAINICKKWAKGDLLQGYDAVILLPLRDPEIQDAKTIGDLLLVDGELKETMLNEIAKRNGERVCFIFDGYDELPHPLHKKAIFARLTEKLPKCTLIYTSRPEACADLRTLACQTIRINGFTKESVDKYITLTFNTIQDGGKEKALRLKSQLNNNQHINNILHIPINLAIVCLVFFYFSMLPDTLTKLYTLLCLRLLLRHITIRTSNAAQITMLDSLDNLPEDVSKQFDDLCFIAYTGMKKHTIIFSVKFLNDIGITVNKLNGLGLLLIAPTTSVYGREKTYNFLHLTLQEFCAARYISKNLSPEEQRWFLKFDHSHNMTSYPNGLLYMFYSGITGLQNDKNVDCIVPNTRLSSLHVLHLINCAHEAHNAIACQMVGNALDGNIDLTGCGIHVLFPAFKYFLKKVHTPIEHLEVSSSYVDDEGFKGLLSLLEERLSRHIDTNFRLGATDNMISHRSYFLLAELLWDRLPLVELYIGRNRNALHTQIKHRIRSLSKLNCKLLCGTLSADVQPLSNAFTSSKTLRVLEVSGLNIGLEGATYLAGCRSVVLHELKISACKLGPRGADKIGEMIYYNKSLVSVNLAYNKIGDSGVEKLVCHLVKYTNAIQTLNLEGNNISAIGARHLRKLIRTGLTSVELSRNPLRDKGIRLVLQAFTFIMDRIGLISVEMTSSSTTYIADALHRVKSIAFTMQYFTDYEVIIDSLAKSNVLQCLETHMWGGFKPKYKTMNDYLKHLDNSFQLHPYLFNIQKKGRQSQKRLWYGTSSIYNHGSSSSVSSIKLDIRHFKNLILPKDLPLVHSYISNISFEDLNMRKQKVATSVDKAFALLLLLQLRTQNYTLKEVTLRLSSSIESDRDFYIKANRYIEEINRIRRKHNVSNPLSVNIILEGKFAL